MGVSSGTGDPDSVGELVASGVYRFGSERINWYVLEAETGLTVVDAGLPGHWSQLQAWLDAQGYELADVAALVLTHGDIDHVGFASRLAKADIPVYCHPDDLDLLESHPQGPPGWFLANAWRPEMIAYLIEMLRDDVRSTEPPESVELYEDGTTLPVPGAPEAIHAPGHTPGSCVLSVEDRDVLFAGDVLATRNITTGEEDDPQLLGAPDENHEQAAASLERLEGLGHLTLLPGHGNPWTGRMETAVSLARK